MGAIWYATVEQVKAGLDMQETARADALIRRALASASDQIEGQLNKQKFYPVTATRYADWPNGQYAYPWRLWLIDSNKIISVTSIVSGSQTFVANSYHLEPANDGPPYEWIEVDTAGPSSFQGGTSFQRSVAITGIFADCPVVYAPAGALSGAVASTTATTLTVTDSSEIGTGSVLLIGTELLIVSARNFATTGQTLATPLTASLADTTVAVASAATIFPGEVLLIDAEQVEVVDKAGNNLVVRRNVNGGALATHTGSTLYARRLLTVSRGALGTTAATHLDAAAVSVYVVPGVINQLAIAEAEVTLQQMASGYGRTVGSGDNQREARGAGLADLRRQARDLFGAGARSEAV